MVLGMILSVFILPVLLRLVSGEILLLLLGLGLGLPLLSNLAGPVQHFRAAILDAWRNKVAADPCGGEVLCLMCMALCSSLIFSC